MITYDLIYGDASKSQISSSQAINLFDSFLGLIIKVIYKFLASLITFCCLLPVIALPFCIFGPFLIIAGLVLSFAILFEFNVKKFGGSNIGILGYAIVGIGTLIDFSIILALIVPIIAPGSVGFICSVLIYTLYNSAKDGWNLGTVDSLYDIGKNICAIPLYLNLLYSIIITCFFLESSYTIDDKRNSLSRCLENKKSLHKSISYESNSCLEEVQNNINIASNVSELVRIHNKLIKNFWSQLQGDHCDLSATKDQKITYSK